MAKLETIPDFQNYEVDADGNVYSKINRKFLKPYLTRNYETVRLCKNKKGYNRRIHRLVLETFVGLCPKGMECCHNNGIKTDNRLENLRWDTRSNNAKDAVKHGDASCIRCGEDSLHHKLTEQDVRMIIYMWKTKEFTHKEIAKVYSVNRTTVSNIINRKSWKHIWKN